ncbi:uncharacterized protein [Rutidosis leptorrhynchoides]|uniref:uncharacterized protein n=1 Tax=Rutidosis leptorrhynchoides TaxID=125765 RepID=UPI003A9A25FD
MSNFIYSETINNLSDVWATPIQNINRKDCVFRNKLKCVKNALRNWSKSYNNLDGDIEVLKDTVTNLELKAETCNLSDSEKILWRESRKKWIEKERVKSCMLKQKARVKWTLDGDENTNFFYSVIKRNNNVCNIRGLMINGIWNDSPTDIKNEVFRHFKSVFEEPNGVRPSMEDLNYPCLSHEDATILEVPFDEKEIRDAVFDCGSSKAPGPDGFNLGFYKKNLGFDKG